ncbi:helix-turn-helix transcriptional regulator [Yersinia massiliensis]|uniref:helix-turn-helix transcriptional regulator n=2 Tax=Yersinia TaxID=629 RepID=UPI000C1570F2|nr:LuxR C-terminal-related transcriptional regulator [Yersinia massiliensis]PHZ22479.1 hypothetical protein CS535_17560 [Yersinia massiliensis]
MSVLKRKKKYTNQLSFSLGDLTLSNYIKKINLTKQEVIIITYFKCGLPGHAVAKILNKSEKTVSAQKRSVMKKIGVRTNAELLQKLQIN